MNFKNSFEELKRRNVFKAALAYLVVGWVIVQVASIVFPAFNVSPEILRTIILVLIIGFPVWLVFAWVYEVTPEGLKKTKKVERPQSIATETSNKFNKIIIGALAIAIVLLGANLYSDYSETGSKKVETGLPVDDPASSYIEKEEKSVAVLAFADMSPKKDQEYFSDGISEEILNLLAKNPELKVMSRTSSFYFKDQEATIEEIGKILKTKYLLEGSVRKAGEVLRISVQLINTTDGSHIWSETYDRKLKDIFSIQDEIAEEVTRKLEVSVLGESSERVDPEAYTLYLKAKFLFEKYTMDSPGKALALLREASAIDPNYAPIWGLMSEIYHQMGTSMPDIQMAEAYELGLKAAKKAVKLDPGYAKGYLGLANLATTQFDFEEARKHAKKALELEPDNAEILRKKGLLVFDSHSEMIEQNRKALELDPLLHVIHFNLGLINFWNGDYEQALKELKVYEDYQPGSTIVSLLRAESLLKLGRIEDAKKVIVEEPDPFRQSIGKIKILYKTGEKAKAVELLTKFKNTYPREFTDIADIYAFMGAREKVFAWLQKALLHKDPTLTEGVYYYTFRKFHNDPRWQQLLEGMGIPEENGILRYSS
jgi:adenylate cyclase